METKSELKVSVVSMAIAALVIIGGFVMLAMGKIEAPAFMDMVGYALATAGFTSAGYSASRGLKKMGAGTDAEE